jgi:hypothetical protein
MFIRPPVEESHTHWPCHRVSSAARKRHGREVESSEHVRPIRHVEAATQVTGVTSRVRYPIGWDTIHSDSGDGREPPPRFGEHGAFDVDLGRASLLLSRQTT